MNESVNDKGDCKTTPATPGLLNIAHSTMLDTVSAKTNVSMKMPNMNAS